MPPRPRRTHRTRGPQPLGDVVWSLVRTIIPDHAIRLALVRSAWERLGLAWLQGKAYPAAIYKDELVVAVEDSQYHHELTYSRQELLHKLRELVPEARLGRLRLRLGVVPPGSAPAPERPRAPPKAILPPEPGAETREALHAVADPELRQAIAGARIMLGR